MEREGEVWRKKKCEEGRRSVEKEGEVWGRKEKCGEGRRRKEKCGERSKSVQNIRGPGAAGEK